jgi:lipoprotein-anchoring transpeptidase ErfK/SrfK
MAHKKRTPAWSRRLWIFCLAAWWLCPGGTAQTEPVPAAPESPEGTESHPVASALEAQVELHRRGFSCGGIDGVAGAQTHAALRAVQRAAELPATGELDEATCALLQITAPALTEHTVTDEDLADLKPVPETWLGKSEQETLAYATLLELLAEHYRASPNFLRRLNPGIDWSAVAAGAVIKVPAVERAVIGGSLPARVIIRLAAHELEVLDTHDRISAHFPVSIARSVEKRPVGELHVVVVIPDPNYTFDPATFPESPEAKTLGRKLILPPGPNNPVGRAWIGLDRPGYGIHGTPEPENVGRTESHGCFRLANWDAVTLLRLVSVGMTVSIEP